MAVTVNNIEKILPGDFVIWNKTGYPSEVEPYLKKYGKGQFVVVSVENVPSWLRSEVEHPHMLTLRRADNSRMITDRFGNRKFSGMWLKKTHGKEVVGTDQNWS